MIRIALTLETDGASNFKSVLAEDSDTPYQLLSHYKIDPKTKHIYLNGRLLSNQALEKPFNNLTNNNKIFIAVRYKA